MSRKRRERINAETLRRRRVRWSTLGAVALVIFTLAAASIDWSREQPSKADPPRPSEEQPVTIGPSTYLAHPLPEDDEKAKELIRAEYFNFDGAMVFQSERDIPLETLLVPDNLFSKEELKIIVQCINTIGAVNGGEDPVFLALKAWAERTPGRLIAEVVPLDKKLAIGSKNYLFAFDAFWSPQMRMLYMGRHQLPYYMLFVSTLYQEGFHAVQLQGRKLTLEENEAIELEAHEAQLQFNQRLRELVKPTENGRRHRLELEVIDQNLRESMDAYKRGLIERTGVPLRRE